MSTPNPTRIRGVDYVSQSAACRTLGVSLSTLCSALERGTLEFVGFGRNYHNKRPIWLDDVKFDTHVALAKHLGMTENCLRSMKTRARRKKQDHVDCRHGRITWKEPLSDRL